MNEKNDRWEGARIVKIFVKVKRGKVQQDRGEEVREKSTVSKRKIGWEDKTGEKKYTSQDGRCFKMRRQEKNKESNDKRRKFHAFKHVFFAIYLNWGRVKERRREEVREKEKGTKSKRKEGWEDKREENTYKQ